MFLRRFPVSFCPALETAVAALLQACRQQGIVLIDSWHLPSSAFLLWIHLLTGFIYAANYLMSSYDNWGPHSEGGGGGLVCFGFGNVEDKDKSACDALWIKPIILSALLLLSPPQLPALASAQQELVHTGGFADLPKAELSTPY